MRVSLGAEKCLRAAKVRNAFGLQDVSERTLFLKNLFARRSGESVELDPNDPVFNGIGSLRCPQDDLAQINAVLALAAQHVDLHRLTIKRFQGWCHILRV